MPLVVFALDGRPCSGCTQSCLDPCYPGLRCRPLSYEFLFSSHFTSGPFPCGVYCCSVRLFLPMLPFRLTAVPSQLCFGVCHQLCERRHLLSDAPFCFFPFGVIALYSSERCLPAASLRFGLPAPVCTIGHCPLESGLVEPWPPTY